ncbi:hypothetical protein [Corallococcus sp. AB038B]|uniref:hypothetical protein n=1 Tax=Corallococcus sp. AB038B TaxID=2316718 RepID=UPI0011C3E5BF|nr:hypothetical protein [Corallococcus sp. AB038B]
MFAIIDQTAFNHGKNRPLSLLELFSLGWDERHAILTRPQFDPTANAPANTWINTLSTPLQREVTQILTQGISLALRRPINTSRITVISSESNWENARININDAVRLLRTPLKILLENSRNDFHFLLQLAPPTQRQELNEFINKGWIEIEQAGGLGEMKTILEDLYTAPPSDISSHIHRLRLWVMFDRDSDAADRSQASAASNQVRSICERFKAQKPWPLDFFQLGRRSIENYIPLDALKAWQAERSGAEGTDRRRTVEAFAFLGKQSPSAKWQYNMKSGFYGDLSRATLTEIENQGRDLRATDVDPIFAPLDDASRQSLSHGFGKDIARLYKRHQTSWETSFEAEYNQGPSNQPQRLHLLSSIISRM